MQHDLQQPSPWLVRWRHLLSRPGEALDVACGQGRHARWLAALGYRVHAVDRDADALSGLAACPGIIPCHADIEAGEWPYAGRTFDAIVVTNYLFRPLLPELVRSIAANGILLYETFALGNEAYGRPSNPAFLLRPGELLDAVRGTLRVVAYEDVTVEIPKLAKVQRICACAQ